MRNLKLLELLYEALNSEIGIVIETNDPARCKAALYVARRTDPALEEISILTSPLAANHFFLIKNGKTSNGPE